MAFDDPKHTSYENERPLVAKVILLKLLGLPGFKYKKPWTWLPREKQAMCYGLLQGDTIELRYSDPDGCWLILSQGEKPNSFETHGDLASRIICECFFAYDEMGPIEWKLCVEMLDEDALRQRIHLAAAISAMLDEFRTTPTFREQLCEASARITRNDISEDERKVDNAATLFRIIQ